MAKPAFRCRECGCTFASRNQLFAHLRTAGVRCGEQWRITHTATLSIARQAVLVLVGWNGAACEYCEGRAQGDGTRSLLQQISARAHAVLEAVVIGVRAPAEVSTHSSSQTNVLHSQDELCPLTPLSLVLVPIVLWLPKDGW